MNRNQIISFRLFIPILLFLLQINCYSQNFRFKLFGSKEGLGSTTIYSVNQSKDGYIWLSTGDGLIRYDGFYFTSQFSTDSISRRVVKSSFKDKNGDLWFGHDDGTITFYNGKNFKTIHTG